MSREEAKQNGDAMRVNPEFPELPKSRQNIKTLERPDITNVG